MAGKASERFVWAVEHLALRARWFESNEARVHYANVAESQKALLSMQSGTFSVFRRSPSAFRRRCAKLSGRSLPHPDPVSHGGRSPKAGGTGFRNRHTFQAPSS